MPRTVDVEGFGLVDFDDAMTDEEIVYAIENDILKTSVVDQGIEFAKAIPRGFAGSFLSAAEGLAELADAGTNAIGLDDLIDSGDDNELVRLAREGRNAVNEGFLKSDVKYQDEWSTKFGEGLGSLASFFTPAGAVKLAGLAGKAASTTQLAGGLTLAGGAGAGDQAQRIQAARDAGIEVSEGEEDASIGLGTLVGFTEMAPVGRLLSKISKSAPKQVQDNIKSRLLSGLKSGGFEGLQEVTANIAQNAIERGIYNEDLAVNNSMADLLKSDEFTVGAASGFVADMVLTSIALRRGRYATQQQKDREGLERESKEERIVAGEQAVSDLQAREEQEAQQRNQEEQALDFQPEVAGIDPAQIDPPSPQQITKQLEIVNPLKGKDGTVPYATKRRNRYIDVVDSTNPEDVENYQAEERVRTTTVKGRQVETRYVIDVKPDGTTQEIKTSVNGVPNPNLQIQELAPQSEGLQANRKKAPALDHANHIYGVLGRSFPTAGKFEVDMPSAENPSVSPNQVVHVSPDGKRTPFGRNVNSIEDASILAGSLNEKILSNQVLNSVAQVINTAPDSYSPEVKRTLVEYGDTILHPDESLYSASEIDSAAGTTIAQGYQEGSRATDLVAEGVPTRKLTASQKINAKRVRDGLPETDKFTPAEAKAVLRGKFGLLIRRPETLRTAIYKTQKVVNKKTKKDEFVLVSENGDIITGRPPSSSTFNSAGQLVSKGEALEQLEAGKRRSKVKFATRYDAQKYASQLNKNLGIDPRDVVLENSDIDLSVIQGVRDLLTQVDYTASSDVVRDALARNNITNDIDSPAIRTLAENFTGVKASGSKKIDDMNKGELKALVQGIRSLPRFDSPTNLPVFKHNGYTSAEFGSALQFVRQNDNDTTNLVGIAESIGLDLMTDPAALKKAQDLSDALEAHIAPVKKVKTAVEPDLEIQSDQAPLMLPSPAPTVDINKLTAILKSRMNSFGLTDIPVRIDYALRRVARNAEGELVFGVSQAEFRNKATGELAFDSEGKPLMGAGRLGINEDPNASVTEAFYSPDIKAIFMAVDTVVGIKDMSPEQQEAEFVRLLDHEMIHGMRQLDLWTEKEWQLLSSLAGKRKNRNKITFLDAAKANYVGPVVQMEEAIAEMTREARADPKIVTGKPRTLLKRITDFYTKSVSAINGFGFNSFDSIIQGIESGEIGSRSRGQIRTLLETERQQGVPFFNAEQDLRAGIAQTDQPEEGDVKRPFKQSISDSEGLDAPDATISETETLSEPEIMESRRRLSTPIQNAVELSKTKYAEYNTQVEDEFFGNFWPSVMQEVKGTVTPDKVRTASKRALKDIERFVADNPKYQDYYQEDMRAIKGLLESEFGSVSDGDMLFYQVANGLSSPATSLPANVGDAVNVFDLYRREGNLDSIEMGLSAKGNLVVASSPFQLSGTTGANKARTLKIIDNLAKEMGGMEQAISFMKESVTPAELQAFNRKMGYKTSINMKPIKSLVNQATGQDEVIPRMFIFGKKIGAYTLNLTGDSRYTTIDVWESRFIRSYFEGLFEKNTGLPVNVAEDALFQDFSKVFKEEYDKLTGTSADPASLQAMRWFYMINAAKQSGYRGASTSETISELTNKKLTRLRKNRNVGRPEDDGEADSKVPTKARRKQVYRELRSPQLSESGSRANEGGVPRRFRPRTGRHSQVLVAGQEVSGSKRELTPSAKAALQEVDSYNGTIVELASNATNANLFASKMQASKVASAYGAAVIVYPESDYQDMKMFMTEDGSAGIAIEDGDTIVSLYSNGANKNVTYSLASLAVEEGGLYSDGFDTLLPIIYEDVGFKVISRLKWDDSKAPSDWDKNTFKVFNKGEPDVVFMVVDPKYFGPYSKDVGYYVDTYEKGMRSVREGYRPDTKSKETAKEFLSEGFNPKVEGKIIPEGAIEKAVEKNIEKARNTPNMLTPVVNPESNPRAQYIAENPDDGLRLSDPEILSSLRRQPEYSPRAKAALDQTVTAAPTAPASKAYLDVTNTGAIGEFFVRAKAKTVNRYARLEQIYNAPDLGYGDVLADSSSLAASLFADRSKGITAETIKRGFVSYKNGITKVEKFIHKNREYRGLIDVMSPLYQNKYGVDLEKLAQGYAIAIRSKRLREEKGLATPADGDTLDALMPEINKYKDENGNNIIEEWFSTWQAYNSKTVEFLLDTGVLDAETAKTWMDQADYVPFYRQAEDPNAPDKMPAIFKGMTSAATFKELKGGDTAVTVPLLDAITRNLDAAIGMGMRNVAQQRIVRDMKSLGLAREVIAGQQGNNIISFRVNGKKRDFAIDDPLMFESMQLMGGGSMETMLTSVVGAPSRVLREMITRDPGFMMVNMLRDTLSTYVTSGSDFVPVWSTLKNATTGVETLSKYGIVGGYDFGNDPDNVFKDFEKEMAKRGDGSVRNIAFRLWDYLGEATTASDAATRKAVYDDVLARTGNEAEAAFQALEVINFSRRGNSPLARVVTAAIPFLNARFQGLDVFVRSARGNYGTNKDLSKSKQAQIVALRGAMLASLTAMYFLMVSDDEQYKNADEHTRDNNWLLPTPWGVPFKVPIPFEIGLIFKTFPEKALAVATGEATGREALKSAITATTGTLGINPLGAQITKPLLEAYMNHNFFTGNPIVSKYLDGDMEAAFIDRDSTNRAATEIGQALGINPLKLEHVMKGYTGTIGSYVLDIVDSSLRSTALSGDPSIQMPNRPVTEYPIIKRFFARNNNSGQKEDFYELHKEIRKITSTLNDLKKKGRIDEYKRYLEGREVLLGLKGNVNYVANQLTYIRNQKSKVMKSDLSPERKKEVTDELIAKEKHVLKVTSVLKRKADLPVFDTLYR